MCGASDMSTSISAYESKKRVYEYDVDMDMMHPNRHKMAAVAFDFLPFNYDQCVRALDLGVGTGFLAQRFLVRYSQAHVVGVDGAASMIELAKTRLCDYGSSIEYVVADFRDLEQVFAKESQFDVVFSAFSLHHLTIAEKEFVLKHVLSLLKPGGWFVNEDCIIAETPEVELRYQKLRIEGILSRKKDTEMRFNDFATLRAWLDAMETKEQDNPIKLSDELCIMHNAGFRNIEVLWKEYREAVICGQR
jgi:tRNA (cmo5U34)-methyltransferase